MDQVVEAYLDEIARWRSGEMATKDAPFGSDAYTQKTRAAIMSIEKKIVDHLSGKKGSGEHAKVQPKKIA